MAVGRTGLPRAASASPPTPFDETARGPAPGPRGGALPARPLRPSVPPRRSAGSREDHASAATARGPRGRGLAERLPRPHGSGFLAGPLRPRGSRRPTRGAPGRAPARGHADSLPGGSGALAPRRSGARPPRALVVAAPRRGPAGGPPPRRGDGDSLARLFPGAPR